LFRSLTIDGYDIYRHLCVVFETLPDKRAPITYTFVLQNIPSPWMTSKILQSKNRRRYLERVWRKTHSSLGR